MRRTDKCELLIHLPPQRADRVFLQAGHLRLRDPQLCRDLHLRLILVIPAADDIRVLNSFDFLIYPSRSHKA